ncbi:MAG: hypothetical protein ABI851_05510 [Saprospiraceae bacterium]
MNQPTNQIFKRQVSLSKGDFIHFSIVPFIFLVLGLNNFIKKDYKPESKLKFENSQPYFYPNVACTRHDVDPCAYISNGAFAYALVAELNSVVMGCPPPTQCSPQCCISYFNTNLLTSYLINSQYINPWIYCDSREDCYPYDCGSFGTMCNYADVALQDLMLISARSSALANRPYCGNQLALIKDIYFYIIDFGEECTYIGDCYNLEIYIHVDYYSCTCNDH